MSISLCYHHLSVLARLSIIVARFLSEFVQSLLEVHIVTVWGILASLVVQGYKIVTKFNKLTRAAVLVVVVIAGRYPSHVNMVICNFVILLVLCGDLLICVDGGLLILAQLRNGKVHLIAWCRFETKSGLSSDTREFSFIK